jgi:hypothetical protein
VPAARLRFGGPAFWLWTVFNLSIGMSILQDEKKPITWGTSADSFPSAFPSPYPE